MVPSQSKMPIAKAISLDIKATEQRFIKTLAHFSTRMHLSIQDKVLLDAESPSTQKTTETFTLLIIILWKLVQKMHQCGFGDSKIHLHTKRELHGFHSELDALLWNTQSVLTKVRHASVMEILSMVKKVTPGQRFYLADTSLRKVLMEQLNVITKLLEKIQLLVL